MNADFDRLLEGTERVEPHELNGLERIVLEVFLLRREEFLSFGHSVLESAGNVLFSHCECR